MMTIDLLGLSTGLEIPKLLASLCICGAVGLVAQRILGIFIKPRGY